MLLVDHPEIEPLQLSFAKAGYQTFGAGKLYHHGAGAIDTRGWTEFFFRNDWQRQAGGRSIHGQKTYHPAAIS